MKVKLKRFSYNNISGTSYVNNITRPPLKEEKFNEDEAFLPWTKENIMKFKSKDNMLKHARIDKTTSGFFCVNSKNNDLIGYACWNNENYLLAFEVSKNYRGKHYGERLFQKALEDGKINKLSVNMKNIPAINLYKKYGFKIIDDNGTMYFMEKKR